MGNKTIKRPCANQGCGHVFEIKIDTMAAGLGAFLKKQEQTSHYLTCPKCGTNGSINEVNPLDIES